MVKTDRARANKGSDRIEAAQIERHEAGMPVVDMDDVGGPSAATAKLERGVGQEEEAAVLVAVVAINTFPVEEGREVDKPIAAIVGEVGVESYPTKCGYRDFGVDVVQTVNAVGNPTVQRTNHRDLVSEGFQSGG